MFGQRPRFPIDLYFPTLRGETEKFCVNHYVADIQKHLEQALEIAWKITKMKPCDKNTTLTIELVQ